MSGAAALALQSRSDALSEITGARIRLDVSDNVRLAALGPYARRDLRKGLKARRLDVPHETIAPYATGDGLLSVMRAARRVRAKDADIHHAEAVLGCSASRPTRPQKSPAERSPRRPEAARPGRPKSDAAATLPAFTACGHPSRAICGPTRMTSGIGCSAQSGGSTPCEAAAIRPKWRSNPAGVQTSR
jgi:hypothetical protein